MILTVDRFAHGSDSTLGLLYIGHLFDKREFHSFTCEDEKRENKIHGETRIPAGVYRIGLRKEGGLIEKYKAKFGAENHPGMIWIKDVPGFEYVYIHIGNDDDDTDGCLLVGEGARKGPDGGGTVISSTAAYLDLYSKILETMKSGEPVYIVIFDR